MRREPLFIRFANGDAGPEDVIESLISSTEDEQSSKIARETRTKVPDLRVFRKDFRSALQDVIESGISQRLINYVDSYMKPSLTEYVDDQGGSRAGERRWIELKEPDTPWIEAIVCYNLTIYIRVYGIREIKLCPVCHKFFSHKGKYAKYCSDGCKMQGKT